MTVALGFPRRRIRTATREDRRTSPRRRLALARDLEGVIEHARVTRPVLSSRVPVRRDQVLSARADIEALAARLRDLARPVKAEHLQLVRALLCDGAGPLYRWAEPGTLRRRVRRICEAME